MGGEQDAVEIVEGEELVLARDLWHTAAAVQQARDLVKQELDVGLVAVETTFSASLRDAKAAAEAIFTDVVGGGLIGVVGKEGADVLGRGQR